MSVLSKHVTLMPPWSVGRTRKAPRRTLFDPLGDQERHGVPRRVMRPPRGHDGHAPGVMTPMVRPFCKLPESEVSRPRHRQGRIWRPRKPPQTPTAQTGTPMGARCRMSISSTVNGLSSHMRRPFTSRGLIVWWGDSLRLAARASHLSRSHRRILPCNCFLW